MSDPDKAADARFDEWEELCEAATAGPWRIPVANVFRVVAPEAEHHNEPSGMCPPYPWRVIAEAPPPDGAANDAAFIATFDPDTVLTLVQALRAIHDAHYEQQTGPDEFRCAECGHHYPCPTKTQLVYPAIGVSDE